MPESKRRNALIGLFVLGGLICLAVLVVKFGETQSWFGNRYTVKATYDRIAGVREGTEVRLAGVWVGNVAKVDLTNRNEPARGVTVEMQIDKDFDIPENWVANVVMPLMGQAFINIMPPPRGLPARAPGEPMIGTVVGPLDQVLPPELQERILTTSDEIRVLASALKPVADDLHELLRKRSTAEVDITATQPSAEQVAANLSTTVQRMDQILRHIQSVVGDPMVQSNLREALANLRTATEDARLAVGDFRQFGQGLQQTNADARKMLANLNAAIDTTHQHIDTLGRKLQQNADQLSRVLDYAASAGKDLAEGQGTLGMLLRDPKFYEELFLTIERLAAAAQDLQVTVKQWQDGGLMLRLR